MRAILSRVFVAAALLTAAVPAMADGPFVYHSLTPCRVADTRTTAAPLDHNETRTFTLQGVCGVPSGAKAVTINLTAVSPGSNGHLRLFPSNIALPTISTINFQTSSTIANGAIVPLHTATPDLSVYAFSALSLSDFVHVVIDVTGYFVSPAP
jgi:hypothetical protein